MTELMQVLAIQGLWHPHILVELVLWYAAVAAVLGAFFGFIDAVRGR